MSILALDQGPSTGVAFLDTRDLSSFWCATYTDDEALRLLHKYVTEMESLETVVYEKITITGKTLQVGREGVQRAIELAGVIKYIAASKELVEQQPSHVMKFAPDARLKKIGWYRPGPDHARDAARHMLSFAVKRGHLNPAMLVLDG